MTLQFSCITLQCSSIKSLFLCFLLFSLHNPLFICPPLQMSETECRRRPSPNGSTNTLSRYSPNMPCYFPGFLLSMQIRTGTIDLPDDYNVWNRCTTTVLIQVNCFINVTNVYKAQDIGGIHDIKNFLKGSTLSIDLMT